MQKLVNQVNSTAYEEIRPRYMLVLSNPDDWQKIENGLMIEYSGRSPRNSFYRRSVVPSESSVPKVLFKGAVSSQQEQPLPFGEYLVAFERVSDNIAYTYCGANYQPIMHSLYKVFGHKEFFLAEIQPLIL